MNNRILMILGLLLIASGAVAAIYFGRAYFNKPPDVSKPPEIDPTKDRPPIPVPKVNFTNVTDPAGITFAHYNGAAGKKLLPETMGGSVCVLDFDGDGRQDLLFVNACAWPGHPQPEKRAASCLTLYRNSGDGKFEDATAVAGLNVTMYGMGACAGDFNNDGFVDLFITGVGGCKLYRNTAGEGGASGAASARRFIDVTADAGIAPKGAWPGSLSADQFISSKEPVEFASSATFVDYDADGKLDLFVCRYVTWAPAVDLSIKTTLTGIGRAYQQPQQLEGSQCVLYRNLGGGKFADVSDLTGIKVVEKEGTDKGARERPVAKSLGVITCDPDGDGWPDLIVANDTVRNFFFHNLPAEDGERKFEEKGLYVNVAYALGKPRGAMGIDWGEYLPGQYGAVIANFADEPITFLSVANADAQRLRFRDLAVGIGLAGPSQFWLKFGTFFFDYDLDGRLDLLVCNGHLEPEITKVQSDQQYAQPPQLFWNTGDQQRLFESITANDSGKDFFRPMVGRGCAYLDYDGDGDLDVVLVENNGRARLLRNDTTLGNKYIRLSLVGDGKSANTSAIGAQITIEAGGKTYRREIAGARGYLSQSELPITLGLGATDTIDKITVRWPGKDAGQPQEWTKLKANSAYTLRQGKPDAEITQRK
ncbi:MAG: CRTAC1 family protein [Planctomycetia bacterium]|nr:CRTAC1 family protein [Planctomycetia bacterium]